MFLSFSGDSDVPANGSQKSLLGVSWSHPSTNKCRIGPKVRGNFLRLDSSIFKIVCQTVRIYGFKGALVLSATPGLLTPENDAKRKT